MKRDNIKKGNIGEQAALKYLKKKGYKIVEVNYRTRYGEIDIVAREARPLARQGSDLRRRLEPVLVFVEVKTKTGEQYGEPWEMVDSRKLGQIKRIAKMYLIKKKLGEPLCRIDVIGVWLRVDESIEKLKHWENVEG